MGTGEKRVSTCEKSLRGVHTWVPYRWFASGFLHRRTWKFFLSSRSPRQSLALAPTATTLCCWQVLDQTLLLHAITWSRNVDSSGFSPIFLAYEPTFLALSKETTALLPPLRSRATGRENAESGFLDAVFARARWNLGRTTAGTGVGPFCEGSCM